MLVTSCFESDFIFGQFGQLECAPASLVSLQKIAITGSNGKQALHFCLFCQVLSIAGGFPFHGTLPKPLWDAFYSSIQELEKLCDGSTPQQVYDNVIRHWSVKLAVDELFATHQLRLNILYESFVFKQGSSFPQVKRTMPLSEAAAFTEGLKRAFVRLTRMLRLPNQAETIPLFEALFEIPIGSLKILVGELNRNGIDDGWAILLMFAPGILQNLKNEVSTTSMRPAVKDRIAVGLKCLVALYKLAREHLDWKQLGVGGERDRRSAGDTETNSTLSADQEPADRHDVNANGVYEVNCFQVATWANNSDELVRIMETKKAMRHEQTSHLQGSRGEAIITVIRNELG